MLNSMERVFHNIDDSKEESIVTSERPCDDA